MAFASLLPRRQGSGLRDRDRKGVYATDALWRLSFRPSAADVLTDMTGGIPSRIRRVLEAFRFGCVNGLSDFNEVSRIIGSQDWPRLRTYESRSPPAKCGARTYIRF